MLWSNRDADRLSPREKSMFDHDTRIHESHLLMYSTHPHPQWIDFILWSSTCTRSVAWGTGHVWWWYSHLWIAFHNLLHLSVSAMDTFILWSSRCTRSVARGIGLFVEQTFFCDLSYWSRWKRSRDDRVFMSCFMCCDRREKHTVYFLNVHVWSWYSHLWIRISWSTALIRTAMDTFHFVIIEMHALCRSAEGICLVSHHINI